MRIIGVEMPGGSPVFTGTLGHGADPHRLAWEKGYRIVRPLSATGGAPDLTLTVQVGRHGRSSVLTAPKTRSMDPGLDLALEAPPVVRQRLAAYGIVLSSRGLLATQFSDRTGLVIDLDAGSPIQVADVATTQACVKRSTWACNWRAVAPDAPRCRSCALVDAGDREHEVSMVPFQSAQRRALYQLTDLGVPWGAGSGLRFAYRSKSAGDDAVIGHRSGEITLDLDEADPASRERIRATLGEHYRTPLGHIRHELGHFVWLTLVASDPGRLAEFRELFGDERLDYSAALDSHYARLDDGAWRDAHASFYASAHPWEDFAESWAQLMHVHDVVETGAEWGVVAAPDDRTDATSWLATSITASVAANELARSMGMRDLYPFALTSGVRAKVEFCWHLLPVRVG